jgi:hypothetical protein
MTHLNALATTDAHALKDKEDDHPVDHRAMACIDHLPDLGEAYATSGAGWAEGAA